MIRTRKKKYYDAEVEKLKAKGSDRIHYKILKNITDTERSPLWKVKSMGKTDNKLSRFYNSISQEFPPLKREEIPHTYDRVVPLVNCDEVEARIRNIKKPSSAVRIDPLTHFLTTHAGKFAEGITPIINLIIQSGSWPAVWKEEDGTIIPKCSNPNNTGPDAKYKLYLNLFKVCESYLVNWLLEEIEVDSE